MEQAEDAALRAILRATFMPGNISLSFQREPSFFAAEQAGNLLSQVLAVRDTTSNQIVGFGCRSLRRLFVDGEAKIVGYLSGLRGLPSVRRGTLLARAYRFLKELHRDGQAPYYVTTIFDDNEYAKTLLTSRRAGLPVYKSLGHLYTYLLPLYKEQKSHCRERAIVRGLDTNLAGAAVESINAFNRQHQFGACYITEDLIGGTGILPGFDMKNLYVCQTGSRVTATLGVWDQNPFKQSVVMGYSWSYRLARPLLNLGAQFGLSAKLPGVGESFPYLYAALVSCAPGEPDLLESLLATALHDWSDRGYAYLLIGVHENSPFVDLLQSLSAMRLSSTIYLVYWEDCLDSILPSTATVPHLEIATL